MNHVINDVVFTRLKQISDSRGAVLHMLRNDSKEFSSFGECYFSEIYPNKIKGWKKHNIQTQNISVPVGEIILVVFDSRKNSPTYMKFLTHNLGRPNNYFRVKIPPGLWYGFKCISSENALIANCSDLPHNTNESQILDIDSDLIPFSWIEMKKINKK